METQTTAKDHRVSPRVDLPEDDEAVPVNSFLANGVLLLSCAANYGEYCVARNIR